MSDSNSVFQDLQNKVFVTIDFVGHRLNWFDNLYELQSGHQKPLRILTLSNLGITTDNDHNFEITQVKTKREVLDYIANKSRQETGLQFIFLEAEHWIKELIQTKVSLKALVVRPYISKKNPKSFFNFLLKHIAYYLISKKPRTKLTYLSTPNMKHYFRPNHWVQDNLTVIDIDSSKIFFENANKRVTVSVPGFHNARKNPKMIIDLATNLEAKYPGAFCFQVTGDISPEIKSLLLNKPKGLFNHKTGYLERSDYLKFLASSDVVLLLYSNRGSSGILLESLTLGLRVAMFHDHIWSGLNKEACGGLILVPRKYRMLEEFLLETIEFKTRSAFVRTSPYEFEIRNHPRGLIKFVFEG